MVDITPADGIPPAEVAEVELYHPHSWWTKYVFSQDAKVIAVQYSATATAIGLVALVLSWLMRLQLGFPGTFDFITPEAYYQFITMGVAPILVVFGAIYHWYPKVTGRMLDETLGRFHFWVTFLGAYLIFFPMAARPAAIRGGPRLSNGRRRKHRRPTAISARTCRSSIAGLMITAYRVPRKTSSRRTWTQGRFSYSALA